MRVPGASVMRRGAVCGRCGVSQLQEGCFCRYGKTNQGCGAERDQLCRLEVEGKVCRRIIRDRIRIRISLRRGSRYKTPQHECQASCIPAQAILEKEGVGLEVRNGKAQEG